MCESCMAHFYHPARENVVDPPLPPRMPDPPFIATDPPARLPGEGRITIISGQDTIRKLQSENDRLRQQVRTLETEKVDNDAALKALDLLCTDLLAQLNATEHAHIYADDTGLYVVDVANHKRYKLAAFENAEKPVHQLPAEYLALCRYPYLQDESCKLPGGHIGEHGPAHQCNIDCGLSDEGCTLPVPANPAAYWKALFWELHGDSCPATCRGHSGG